MEERGVGRCLVEEVGVAGEWCWVSGKEVGVAEINFVHHIFRLIIL